MTALLTARSPALLAGKSASRRPRCRGQQMIRAAEADRTRFAVPERNYPLESDPTQLRTFGACFEGRPSAARPTACCIAEQPAVRDSHTSAANYPRVTVRGVMLQAARYGARPAERGGREGDPAAAGAQQAETGRPGQASCRPTRRSDVRLHACCSADTGRTAK